MPVGALNCLLDSGQTDVGPLIEQAGSGATVRTISSVSVQPLACSTANVRVALDEETCALAVNELSESIVAVPDTTLQVVETIVRNQGVATPLRGKVVDVPSALCV